MSQHGLGCKHCVQPPGLNCRNLAAYTTLVPWCAVEGLRLLLLQKARALPPPACHPLTMGPSWGTGTVTLVQGNLCYLIVGSTKLRQRETLQKGGRSHIPQGPQRKRQQRGAGRVLSVALRAGRVRAGQGPAPATAEITPRV